MDPVASLIAAQREFASERDWDQFHTPKNIAMALGGEVGELVEAVSDALRSPSVPAAPVANVADEVGDVALYLLRLYDLTGQGQGLGLPEGHRHAESPSNLDVAFALFELVSSTGRVLDTYQWVREGDPPDSHPSEAMVKARLDAVAVDFAQVCNVLGIEPITAATAKLAKNGRNYPVEHSRGSNRKYTGLTGDGR